MPGAGINIVRVGEWDKAARLLAAAPARLAAAQEAATLQEAHFFRRKIVEGFRTQAPAGERFAPLSPLTLAVRKFTGFGGSKALIVRGDLRNSVKVVRQRGGYFVGVLRSARGRRGQSLFNVAQIHEFGSGPIVQEVTERMRGFLAAAFTHAFGGITPGDGGFSTGIIVSRIPARPFLRPVFEKYGQPADVRRRYLHRVSVLLGLQYGFVPPPRRR